jgi:hypothetical protein
MALFSIFKKKNENGPVQVFSHYKVEEKLGLIKGDEIITEAIYSHIRYSAEMNEPAAVCIDSMWGFIDQSGEQIIPLEFEEVGSFQNKHTIVKKDNLFGVYNDAGEVVLAIGYDSISTPKPDFFLVSKKARQGVFRNTKVGFTEIIPVQYDRVDPDFYKNCILVYSGDQCGLFDYNGSVIAPVEFALINKMRDEDLFLVSKDDKFGIYDSRGQQIAELKYDYISDFEGKLAIMKIDEKWGMIDVHGQEIIEAKFDKLEPFDNHGFAAFDTNGITGYIKREDLFKK